MTETAATRMRRLKALSDEVDAVSAHFRCALAMLQDYKFAVRDADPLFVCLAGGCEKLLKLTLGLHGLEVHGRWPKANVMRQMGHRITALDARVRSLIRERMSQGTSPGYIEELLNRVMQDPYIDQILKTLERYADRGRFYNLDYLGDRLQPEASPAELWENLPQELLTHRPDVLAQLASPDRKVGRREINQAIEKSVRLWCELVGRSWMTGVFGDQAKR